MRWITRHAVFTLCFMLGTSAWYIIAQKKSIPVQSAPAVVAASINQTNAPVDSRQMEEVPNQSIKFGPIEPVTGYANTKTLILRESADAGAAIVAKLNPGDFETVEILGATRDFLHVRFPANDGSVYSATPREQEHEGWTTWGSVVPDMSAIVLDAETGAVISRVPLHDEVSSITYSPDGSRAIFSTGNNGINQAAFEVRTSDYTLTRRLASSDKDYIGTLFYGPASDALYAVVHTPDSSAPAKGKVRVIRIGEDYAPNAQSGFDIIGGDFAVSPDGLTGFVPRPEISDHDELMVDVIDLKTQMIRNTFTLDGENLPSDSSNFVLNRDGTELYIRLSENADTISVIDTRTGRHVRELQVPAMTGWSYFSQGDLVGDSLLLSVWKRSEDEMHSSPNLYWIGNSGRVKAESGIASVVEAAGGKRYAVNANGTRLFKLDASNRIRERITIARPELQKGATASRGLSVFRISASPDGKRLVMFVGIEQGC